MGRSKFGSPRLTIRIDPEKVDEAVQSNSGGCLVADAIRAQHPEYTGVVVDMATTRFSDRKKGVRYTYLTPATAQLCLLSFDQGWPNPVEEVLLKRAVKIVPSRLHGQHSRSRRRPSGRERIEQLEAKRLTDGLNRREQASLARMRNPRTTIPERPSRSGSGGSPRR